MLNAKPSQSIRLAAFYTNVGRLDVYVGDRYIYPNNAKYIKDDGSYTEGEPTYSGEFIPGLTEPIGANFLDREAKLLYIIIRGDTPVDVRTAPTLFIAFGMPAVSTDEFFGANIVNNLAAFLGIPKEKIRIVKIISESGSGRRRRRATGGTVQIEISSPPTNDTGSLNSTAALDRQQLANASSAIMDATQLGTLNTQLNLTISGVTIQEPQPAPSSPEWKTMNNTNGSVTIQVPDRMILVGTPKARQEGGPFSEPIRVRMVDKQVCKTLLSYHLLQEIQGLFRLHRCVFY